MNCAKVGDRVRVQYARVRTTAAKTPRLKVVEFTVGSGEVMPGLSSGVTGMAPGESRRFTLQPGDAYGPVKPALIKEIPRQHFPRRITLRVGKRLSALSTLSGRRRRVRVVEIKPGAVVIDGNHQLAGKVVELDVQMISVDSSCGANQSRAQLDSGGQE